MPLQATRTEPLARQALPWLLFAATLTLTLVLAGWSMRQNATERSALLERRVDALRLSLASVLRSYLDILPGLRLAASGPAPMNDLEFKHYAETVLGQERFPGLAISFVAERWTDAERDMQLARVRGDRSVQANGRPTFEIVPAGRRPEYMLLRHQHPADPPTEGYDLYDPTQRYRAAVDQTIASGGLVATAPLQLARDRHEPKRPELTSIVVRAATYRDAELPAAASLRSARATGVVGIGFRTDMLVRSALPPDLREGTRVRITDPGAAPDAAVVFDQEPGAALRPDGLRFALPVADRIWQVEVMPPATAWWQLADVTTAALLVAGLVSAVSLATLTGGLARARIRAEERVREGVKQLRLEKAQLARSEARLRMLFENSFDAVINSRPNGEIISANPAACALFRMDEAQLRAASREQLADLSDPRLTTLLAQRTDTGRAEGLMRLRRGDGSFFEAEVSSTVYRDVDGSLLASLIVRDVSARLEAAAEPQRLEGQLRHAQKMEAVGTLAGGIAHDFNNMLAVVLGSATLLADTLGADHPGLPQLMRMRQASLRGRSLVQQLLTFSRPSAEGLCAQPLQPLVEEALSLLRVTLPATVQLASALTTAPLAVLTEATQIQQILINLCTNAWQAMPGHKGCIEVALEAVAANDGHWARLSVQDNGSGMDAATRDRIFEPFFSTKANGQGTGLGLAMVHGIVTGHGGHIDVDSMPGQGTRFDVWLPVSGAQLATAEPAPAAAAAPREGQGQRVLYLDDDEVLRLTFEALLNRLGYRAETLTEPAALIAAVAAAPHEVALVVTDFNMPQMDGLDVAKALQQLRADLPVLIVSGHITDALRAAAQLMPHVRLMNKERAAEQLADLAAEMLAERA